MKINENIIFGVGMSSFQIEGSGEKRDSLWDHFCKKQDSIKDESNALVSCDFLKRYKDDIDLMSDLKIQSYRMSISFARIYPNKNEINRNALEIYRKIFEYLKLKKIDVIVTLNHWDIPMWFYELGGFENKDNICYFVDYCDLMFKEYDKYVSAWITHNEPFVVSILGYLRGIQAPGVKNINKAFKVSYNLLLSHGYVVKRYRQKYNRNKIGIVVNLCPAKSEDNASELADAFINLWYLEPLFKKKFPKVAIERLKYENCDISFIEEKDLEIISEKIDFLGVNFYGASHVKQSDKRILGYVDVPYDKPTTREDYENEETYFYDLLNRLKESFVGDMPIYVTENGLGESSVDINDSMEENAMLSIKNDTKLEDDIRIYYIEHHIRQLTKFNNENNNQVERYYLWSFLDNFEWSLGYTIKFGIVSVDFETLERHIKKSAYWYKNIIESREI